MTKEVDQITKLAFQLQRLMKHKVIEEAELGKDVSLLHLQVLGIVHEKKGITMKELANFLKITAPSATSLVARLVKAGLLERRENKHNRKLVCIHITKKGEALFIKNIQKSQKVVASILSVLSKKDQKDMLRIYSTLIESLSS